VAYALNAAGLSTSRMPPAQRIAPALCAEDPDPDFVSPQCTLDRIAGEWMRNYLARTARTPDAGEEALGGRKLRRRLVADHGGNGVEDPIEVGALRAQVRCGAECSRPA